MKIGITGATGFIGSLVSRQAKAAGHEVVVFSRHPEKISQGEARLLSLDAPPDISGLDVIVNLAGESIIGLWTASKKKRIRDSRIQGTRRIVEAIAAASEKPVLLVNASAIGYYGDTGDTLVDEASPLGTGFLSDVCHEWEQEALKAQALGVRVVRVRIGFVLGKEGALSMIAPLFRLGLGGKLGNGRHWMSCVHADDVAGMILWAIHNETLTGTINAVMPEPVRNEEFTRELARAVHRPAFLPAPAFALRLVTGEMSHVLLDSIRVRPRRAGEEGYHFKFAALPAALQAALD